MEKETKKDYIINYRELSEMEQDMFVAFLDKHNNNMYQMVLDKDFLFKSYPQVHFYCTKYELKNKLVSIRTKRAKEVIELLQDSKIRAIENAQRLLSPQHKFVYTKTGMQLFDKEGNPLIVENLPYYKEIKTAWDIIKAELGEPTNISSSKSTHEVTGKDGEAIKTLSSVTWNIIDGTKGNDK